jgi:uracil-DNA glycosylase family 4
MDPKQVAEHLRFFQEIGITGVSRDRTWRGREGPSGPGSEGPMVRGSEGPTVRGSEGPTVPGSEGPTVRGSAGPKVPWTLTSIREDIGDCTRCKLATLGRKQVVFGVGNPRAELMFVGEAPGADEDVQGVPFVGRAGQLLTKMIEAMGFSRDDVYIANVVKCRPPENRNPEPDEIESCEPFLFRQIEAIKPKVVVALGAFAAKTLLKSQDPISKLRGQVYDYHGAKLIPTFHPSFLLRSPGQKKYAWEDLKKALAIMDREPPASAAATGPDA